MPDQYCIICGKNTDEMQQLADGSHVHRECFQPSQSKTYRSAAKHLAALEAQNVILTKKTTFLAKLFLGSDEREMRENLLITNKQDLVAAKNQFVKQVAIRAKKTNEAQRYKDRIVGLWPDYPPEPYWDELRCKTASLANYQCEDCRRKLNLESGHAHHKVQLRFGGYNEVGNLAWLCFDCHQGRHSHKLGSGRKTSKTIQAKTPLQKIDLCISQKAKLRIEYIDGNGRVSSRLILPISRFIEGEESLRQKQTTSSRLKRRKWVTGYCYKRRAERTFRIDRIKSAKIIK